MVSEKNHSDQEKDDEKKESEEEEEEKDEDYKPYGTFNPNRFRGFKKLPNFEDKVREKHKNIEFNKCTGIFDLSAISKQNKEKIQQSECGNNLFNDEADPILHLIKKMMYSEGDLVNLSHISAIYLKDALFSM
jgi:hypothetical protein